MADTQAGAERKRVLIAEDEALIRLDLAEMLVEEGYDVVGEAGDGVEAVECAARLKPDLVLLDVQLPDMDGFEIATLLQGNGHRPAIVLTSSRDAAEFGSLIEQSPARGFVPKAELSGGRLAELLS